MRSAVILFPGLPRGFEGFLQLLQELLERRFQVRAHIEAEQVPAYALTVADGGFKINRIDLLANASVDGIGEEEFQRIAEATKQGCPVSKALAAVDITLDARLESSAAA